jgi:hypothetical protein
MQPFFVLSLVSPTVSLRSAGRSSSPILMHSVPSGELVCLSCLPV